MDGCTPSEVTTAESIRNQADNLEQAVSAFKIQTHYALRSEELKNKTKPGLRPRALGQTMLGVRGLGENLVQQNRAQIITLARSKACFDGRQRTLCKHVSVLRGEDIWLPPGRPGVNYWRGIDDQCTLNNPDTTPDQLTNAKELEIDYRRAKFVYQDAARKYREAAQMYQDAAQMLQMLMAMPTNQRIGEGTLPSASKTDRRRPAS